MSDITMCTLHSEKPYYITEINKNIYSIEELNYYLYNYLYLVDEEFFSADEVGTYKRGRNTKGSKNESLDHMHSTGFEAVIGTLYLEENFDRIKVIFERYKQYINNK